MPVQGLSDKDRNAVRKLFDTKEDELTPEILILIEHEHMTFEGPDEIVVLPAQNAKGIGRITAEVKTLTNQDLYQIEKQAQIAWPSLRAYERYIKTEKLVQMVQRVRYHGPKNECLLDFTQEDGRVQARGFFELTEVMLFERFYQTCVEDVETHVRNLISKVLAKEALLLKK